MKTTKELGKELFDLHQSKGLSRTFITENLHYEEDLLKEIMQWYDHFDLEHRTISREGAGNKFGLGK